MGLTSRHAAASLSGALKCALFYVRVLSSLNLSLNLIHLSKLRGAASWAAYTELVRSNPATRGSTEHSCPSVHDSPTPFDKASLNTTVATMASRIKELEAKLDMAERMDERKEKCLQKCDDNHFKCKNYCSSCTAR